MRALLVEDSPTARLRLQHTLEQRGHQVTAVGDGETGWSLCQEQHFPLIVLDWELPGISGLDLCCRIRGLAHGEASVILVITARANQADHVAVLAAGATDYLPKSADVEAIAVRLAVAEQAASEIARRQQAERQLRQQLAFSRTIMESLGDGVYTLGYDGRVTFMNPAAETMLGWAEEELLGQPMHERIHFQRADGRHVPAAECPLLGVVREGTTITVDADVFTRKDGTVFPVEYTSAPIQVDGQVVGTVLAFRDISERKQADLALRQSEERVRALLERVEDLVCILEADGTIRFASASFERILGYAPEELIGRNAYDYFRVDERDQIQVSFREAAARGDLSDQLELHIRRSDGSWCLLESVRSNYLHDPAIKGIVITSRDITERKEAERQLTKMAHYDRLTGLPNRALLTERLEQATKHAAREDRQLAVLFLDLDGFKMVNDTFGHAAGDQLLQEVAARLTSCVRATDTVARLAGDEFVVLLPDSARGINPAQVAGKILYTLGQSYDLAGSDVRVSASIGISIFPHDGNQHEIDTLVSRADAAMYTAKRQGKSRYAFA